MTPVNAILSGIFDGFTWIRCEGKGSFQTSPLLKECADRRVSEGERWIVVDLEACTGMDSTFMGLLAGLAARLSKLGGGVQVAGAGERNRASLEDLGLDCLMEIDPPTAMWRGKVQEIRAAVKPWVSGALPDMRERAKHVFDAHQTLAGLSEDNARKFAGVLGVLGKEIGQEDERVR